MTAGSAVVFDEGISGDLSGNFAAPTPVSFVFGANTIVGEIGDNGNTGATNGSDADYVSFTVPFGSSISSINIDNFNPAAGIGLGSFMGFTNSLVFNGQTGADINGSVIFNGASGDVLPAINGGPLGPGDYSFWVQETASTTVGYQFTFSQVPEPTSSGLLLATLTGFAMSRRQRPIGLLNDGV